MIHGAATLLPQGSQTKHNEQLFIDMIRCGCEELTQTLNEFLDFSKYKARPISRRVLFENMDQRPSPNLSLTYSPITTAEG